MGKPKSASRRKSPAKRKKAAKRKVVQMMLPFAQNRLADIRETLAKKRGERRRLERAIEKIPRKEIGHQVAWEREQDLRADIITLTSEIDGLVKERQNLRKAQKTAKA